jgi:hypothetical protein
MIIPTLTKHASVSPAMALPPLLPETSHGELASMWSQVMRPPAEADQELKIAPGSYRHLMEQKYEQEQAMITQLGEWESARADDQMTDHGLLVILGRFAEALGLLSNLATVTIPQQQGPAHTPQEKLVEFLVGILAGIPYLQDLNESDHPLVQDEAVGAAWGQESFAHYSGVSRTLAAADETTLAELIAVLRRIGEPFVEQAVLTEMKQQGYLVADIDLAGRPVSPTSRDYADSSFGYMDDAIQKGYQLALVSLACRQWQRLLVAGQRYTGRTLSAHCLQTAVMEMEAVLGVRPQRRVDLVQQRYQAARAAVEKAYERLTQLRAQERQLWQQISQAQQEAIAYQVEVDCLTVLYQEEGREEKPYGQLAKVRRKLTAAQKRYRRRGRQLRPIQCKIERQLHEISQQEEALVTLADWLAHLETDNDTNPNPMPIVLRVDAGFSTGPNLTWLIEMGYTVLTKAYSGNTATALRQQLPTPPDWTPVGSNAWAVDMGDYYQNDCPYPLQAMLVQYRLPNKCLYTTLFYYGECRPATLPAWFAGYNGRQTIEAGIKEAKGVFTLKRHLVRSPIGMQIQEQLALFAANFVRWAADWLDKQLVQANRYFRQTLTQVKTLVHTAAHASARWVSNAHGETLIFAPNGPFAGTIISLTGRPVFQLVLPLFSLQHF